MKTMRKLFRVLLALAMTLALAVPAFAAETTGSITITNPQGDHTYTAYKIFDVTYSGDNYSYTISDTDTGTELTLLSGEIVPVTITGCIRGAAGSPGELRGEFSAKAVGRVLANDAAGVYGSYTGGTIGQAVPVANVQEVTPGEAELWTTVQ